MKPTVGKKIVGIVLLLLVFMLTSSGVSLYLLDRVIEELHFFAGRKLPFSHDMRDIHVLILEQHALVERMHAHHDEKRAIEEDAQAIAQLHEETLRLFDDAAHRLRVRDESHARIDYKEERLTQELARVRSEYDEFRLFVDRIHQAAAADRSDALENAHVEFETFEDHFENHMDRFRETVEELARQSILHTERDQVQAYVANFAVTLLGAVSGLLLSLFFVRRLVGSIRRLAGGARDVERGVLDVEVPVTTRDEMGYLTQSFNNMVAELRMKERIKQTFGKYMDPRVVQELIDSSEITRPGGVLREMSVMFIDLKGFTTISERVLPGELVALVNQFLSSMAEAIGEHKGVVDKFIGDAVMAFWGEPFVPAGSHAVLACSAARGAIGKLDDLNRRIDTEFRGLLADMPIGVRIGISSGEMVVGSIGSENARNFTVLGDAVNLAARLESLNNVYGSRILVSDRTRQLVADRLPFREIDTVRVLGKKTPETIHELMESMHAYDTASYARGLKAYYEGDWLTARAAFQACGRVSPEDAAARAMLERLEIVQNTVADQRPWDGVWRFDFK